jgi:hypothetical protein
VFKKYPLPCINDDFTASPILLADKHSYFIFLLDINLQRLCTSKTGPSKLLTRPLKFFLVRLSKDLPDTTQATAATTYGTQAARLTSFANDAIVTCGVSCAIASSDRLLLMLIL